MKSAKMVYVGDYGTVPVGDAVLKAYGLPQYPINRRSSKQRRALARLEANVRALQEQRLAHGAGALG